MAHKSQELELSQRSRRGRRKLGACLFVADFGGLVGIKFWKNVIDLGLTPKENGA